MRKVRIRFEEFLACSNTLSVVGPLVRTFVLRILKSRFQSFLKTGVSTDMSLRVVESFTIMLPSVCKTT